MNDLAERERRLKARLLKLQKKKEHQKQVQARKRAATEIRNRRFSAILRMRSVSPPMSFSQIGKKFGISSARAHIIYGKAIEWRKSI